MQKIKFLGWERPAIELVVEELLALNKADANEFRRATVVVPTAESGRRLRELLAERAECGIADLSYFGGMNLYQMGRIATERDKRG